MSAEARPAASIRIQKGAPRYMKIALTSWKRPMGFSPGTGEQAQILHIALAPAQIALDEIRQAGRIFLPAFELIGDDAHLIARRAHQRGFHLVMAQHRTAEGRPAGQQRKAAMSDEGLQPDDGVMAPIGPARPLPPGDPDGMGAHAVAHAELEDPGEGALGRLADDQRLENAEASDWPA